MDPAWQLSGSGPAMLRDILAAGLKIDSREPITRLMRAHPAVGRCLASAWQDADHHDVSSAAASLGLGIVEAGADFSTSSSRQVRPGSARRNIEFDVAAPTWSGTPAGDGIQSTYGSDMAGW